MRYGKKLPYIGKNFAVTDGVITGCFYKNGDLDKAQLDVVETAQHSHIYDTCVPRFLFFNIPLVLGAFQCDFVILELF